MNPNPANPLSADPFAIALMQRMQQQGQPQQPPAAAPPPTPTAATPTPSASPAVAPDPMNRILEMQQQLMPYLTTALKQGAAVQPEEEKLRAQITPVHAYHPQFGGGFLHNIGEALKTAAIDNPFVLPYFLRGQEREQAAISEKLKTLQAERQASTGEAQAASAGMGGLTRPIYQMAGVQTRQERNRIMQEHFSDVARNIDSEIDTRREQLKLTDKRLNIDQQYKLAMEGLKSLGLQVEMRGQDIQFATREDAVSALFGLQGSKIWNELDGSIKSKLMQAAGLFTPAEPVAPEGKTPTMGRTTHELPPKPNVPGSAAKNATGAFNVTDPRGVVHTFKDQASADAFKKAAGIK